MLGRLIPLEGSREVPGATRSASKGVSVGSGRAITFVESGCGFEGEEEVVDAAAIGGRRRPWRSCGRGAWRSARSYPATVRRRWCTSARLRRAPYMDGAGESRAGVDRVGFGRRFGCECGGPALHRRSRERRRRSDWGCDGSFQRGAARMCQALCGNASQAFRLVGPVFARDRSGGLLEIGEDVVGATGDLARDGERGALRAATLLGARVESVVGAPSSAGVVGRLGEGPAELG